VEVVRFVEVVVCFPAEALEVFPAVDSPLFFVLCFVEVVVSEDFAPGSSHRFPSSGETANKAQSTVANTRADPCLGRGERTGFIVSM
jgi:hypothetical protein